MDCFPALCALTAVLICRGVIALMRALENRK